MVDLIHAYNAALWIEDFFLTATNMTPDIPLLQNLRHLDDLLCDLSPIFDKNQDYEDQPFSHILEDKHLTVEDMINLLRAYSAFKELKLLVSLVGGIDPRNSILLWFEHMEKLLKDLSPLYSEGLDQENEDFTTIIEDNSLDPHFKACILLCPKRDLERYKNPSSTSDMAAKNEEDIKNTENQDIEPSVSFTVDNMVDLLTAIYAYESLDEVLEMFTGSYLENDIIYGLCHLKEILYNISPRYNGEIDDDATDFYNTLKTLDLGLHDKARWMMGNNL